MGEDGGAQELASLAAAVHGGQRAAEEELVRRLTRPLRMMFRMRRVPAVEIDDLVQETLMIVLRRLRSEGLQDLEALQAFTEATAMNVMIGEFRKQSRRQELLDKHGEMLEPAPELPPEHVLTHHELTGAVRQSVSELKQARDQQLLREYYLNDIDKPQLCAQMSVSAAHFDRILFNARERLRALLSRRGVQELP